jgi:N-acetylmuramoyl-L-alanine amidase
MIAMPVDAASIANYRLDTVNNRFEFSTSGVVTPVAELVTNPSRIVIDLPGVTVRNPRTENKAGLVRQIRFGQVNSQTARIVLQLAPGYEPDVSQIRVRGITRQKWVLEMPAPGAAPVSPIAPSSGAPVSPIAPSSGAPSSGASQADIPQ